MILAAYDTPAKNFISLIHDKLIDYELDDLETKQLSSIKCQDKSVTITSQKKILVIEDLPNNQEVLKSLLENLGCQVDIAQNGQQALAMPLNEYDAILLDLGLPDMDGMAVSVTIRKQHENKKTPIIAITASNEVNLEQRCIIAGIDAVTNKPIVTEKLLEIFGRYCKK